MSSLNFIDYHKKQASYWTRKAEQEYREGNIALHALYTSYAKLEEDLVKERETLLPLLHFLNSLLKGN